MPDDAFEQFEEIISNTSIDRTTISKDDVLRLLEAGLEKGDPFATEFNERVVGPLARKIESRIHVTSVEVDGSDLGQHISKTFKDTITQPTEKVAVSMGKSFDVLNKSFGTQLNQIARKKNLIDIPDFISPDYHRQRRLKTNWQRLQNKVLVHARKAVDDSGVKLSSGLRVGDLLVPRDPNRRYKRQWQRLQNKILSKAEDAVQDLDLFSTDRQLSVRDFIPDRGKPSRSIRRRWNQTQLAIFDAIENSAKDIQPIEFPKMEQERGGYRSILEQSPEIRIGGYTDEAMRQLKGITPAVDQVVEQKEPDPPKKKWGLLAKIAMGILTGMAGLAAYSLFNQGPLKAVKDTVLEKVGVVKDTIINIAAEYLPDFLKAVVSGGISLLKDVTGVLGLGVSKVALKIGGAGIIKPLDKVISKMVGKFFTKGVLKKLPIIGTLISLGYAITRFKQNDWIGGLIDLASGVAVLVPGIGTVLSIGLDVFNAWLDTKGGATQATISATTGTFKSVIATLKSKLAETLPNLPVIGSIIKMGDSFGKILQGDISGGLRGFADSLLDLPGMRSAVSLMVDVFETSGQVVATAVTSTGNIAIKVRDKIRDYIRERVMKMPIFDVAKGLFLISTGSAAKGFRQLADGLLPIPIIGEPFYQMIHWIFGDEPTAGIVAPPPSINMLQALQDELKNKILDMYKAAPSWMRWMMKRVPGMSGLLESEPDVELDIEIAEKEDRINELREQIEKKRQKINRSLEGDNEYIFSDTKGRTKDIEEARALAAELRSLVGEKEKPMDDFIMRPGSKAQPFNSRDNILSIKDNQQFDRLIDLLSGKFEGDKESSSDTIRNKLDQEDFRREIKQLLKAIEKLVMVQQSQQTTPSGQEVIPRDHGGLTPIDAQEIRDPAYMLRARVWNFVRTGSALL